MSSSKSCLIISYGPVPTPQHQTIEGGGMRAWGLATGLQKNGVDVTVGIHESFPQDIPEHQGVSLRNWSPATLADIANSYDTVIMSYCMGEPSEIVAKNLADSIQLVLDAYVPIYVEISARRSEHIEQEYLNYMDELTRFDLALKRGDYFICANDRQKTFYTGVLSALGRINPITYPREMIEVVPFGIDSEPVKITAAPKVPGIAKDDFVVLWFGGLYPWFNIRNLIRAVQRLNRQDKKVKLLVVGGKNPFNPDPTFFQQYDEAVAYAKSEKLLDNSVFFVDWVDYSTRANWYQLADVVISINTAGQENQFSWRTRVMDYVWGGLPIASNGGDPLSDMLIEQEAAYKLTATDESSLTDQLEHLYKHPSALKDLQKRLQPIRQTFFWETVTANLAQVVESSTRAADLDLDPDLERAMKERARHQLVQKASQLPGARQAARALRIPGYIKRYGLRSSFDQATTTVRQLTRRRESRRQYVFLSHPMDHSGGPLVLMDMLGEFQSHHGAASLRVIAPHIEHDLLKQLRAEGITVEAMDPRLGLFALGLRLRLEPDDFVLLNTSIITANYRDAILALLSAGRLHHAYWYVHEDDPEAHFGKPAGLAKKISGLIKQGKLAVCVPSLQMQAHYQDFFDAEVAIVPLHVDVDAKYRHKRPAADYRAIKFFLSGAAISARKGQPTALFAFYKFLTEHYHGHEDKYRDFGLSFIGLGDDYLSRQLKLIGAEALGERFTHTGSVSRAEALAITAQCNAVICCSLMEAFGLYVAEGMYMGHVVLRNDCAGIDEQLKPGVNGYLIDSQNLDQFTAVIEQILNKSKTTDQQLQKMGVASQSMIAEYAKNSYYRRLMELEPHHRGS